MYVDKKINMQIKIVDKNTIMWIEIRLLDKNISELKKSVELTIFVDKK